MEATGQQTPVSQVPFVPLVSKKKKKKRAVKSYSIESMHKAVCAVQKEGLSQSSAAKKFGVPRSTLQTKLSGQSKVIARPGPSPILPEYVEKELFDYCSEMAKRGFPLKAMDLRLAVYDIIRKSSFFEVFKKGIPSRSWTYRFFDRHPLLKNKKAEHHSLGRARVTKESLLAWYANLMKFVTDNSLLEVFKDPECVFNLDETAFFLNDNRGKFIGRKYQCLQSMTTSSEKDNVTVAINFSAAGKMAPPMVVLKRKKLSASIQASVPHGMIVHRSNTGWMKGATFHLYLKEYRRYLVSRKLLDPKGNQKKTFLFVDGHSSHLSYRSSIYCEEVGIVLYSLYPNATHVQQPADVGAMNSLQSRWAVQVQKHRIQKPGLPITNEEFPSMAMEAIQGIDEEVLRVAFECCGICPYNPNRVNFDKLLSTHQQAPVEVAEDVDIVKKLILDTFETKLSKSEIELFRAWHTDQLNEPPMICRLYQVWRGLYLDVYGKTSQHVPTQSADVGISTPLAETMTMGVNVSEVVPEVNVNMLDTSSTSNNESSGRSQLTLIDQESEIVLMDLEDSIPHDNTEFSGYAGDGGTPRPDLVEDADIMDVGGLSGDTPELSQTSESLEQQMDETISSLFPDTDDQDRGVDVLPLPSHHPLMERQRVLPILREVLKIPVMKKPQNKRRIRKQYHLSSEEHRSSLKNKENDDDWVCCFCKAQYSEELRKLVWVNCDGCDRNMHVKCIPETHQVKSNLKQNMKKKTFEFKCNFCSED